MRQDEGIKRTVQLPCTYVRTRRIPVLLILVRTYTCTYDEYGKQKRFKKMRTAFGFKPKIAHKKRNKKTTTPLGVRTVSWYVRYRMVQYCLYYAKRSYRTYISVDNILSTEDLRVSKSTKKWWRGTKKKRTFFCERSKTFFSIYFCDWERNHMFLYTYVTHV